MLDQNNKLVSRMTDCILDHIPRDNTIPKTRYLLKVKITEKNVMAT